MHPHAANPAAPPHLSLCIFFCAPIANQLRDAGISADTLQGFLARVRQPTPERHLYMVDESSLASTKQMRDFLAKLEPGDRVLLIGDTRQHQGVEAGKPFEQLVNAGMKTARVDQIVRQRNAPELLKAVEHLSRGEIAEGVALLEQQGRVTEIPNAKQRIAAIAKSYAANPENTIVVSPITHRVVGSIRRYVLNYRLSAPSQ